MAQPIIQIIELAFVAFLSAIGQILIKRGLGDAGMLQFNFLGLFNLFKGIFLIPQLFIGCIISALGAFSWLLVLSRLNLSYAVPVFTAIYFIFSLLLSLFWLNENITLSRMSGVFFILVGIGLISRAA